MLTNRNEKGQTISIACDPLHFCILFMGIYPIADGGVPGLLLSRLSGVIFPPVVDLDRFDPDITLASHLPTILE
jgi:hypothetical protein